MTFIACNLEKRQAIAIIGLIATSAIIGGGCTWLIPSIKNPLVGAAIEAITVIFSLSIANEMKEKDFVNLQQGLLVAYVLNTIFTVGFSFAAMFYGFPMTIPAAVVLSIAGFFPGIIAGRLLIRSSVD